MTHIILHNYLPKRRTQDDDRHTRGDQGAATILGPDSKIARYDGVSGVTGLRKTGRGDAAAKPPFEQWMRNVDKYCYAIAGISIHDLEDCPFRDWYDAGVSERSAAHRCIKRAKNN